MSIVDKFNPLNLSGRRIMVTGASSGIGRATSIYLSKLGATVVLVARNNDRLQQTMSLMDGTGHSALVYDFENDDTLSDLFIRSMENGKLNGLVHCAGIAQVLPLNMLTRKRMLREMTVNYFAYIELIKEYAKPKFSNGGSIVGISSIAADRAGKCQTNYSASKAAMDIASQALALELVDKGIRINTILPGMIQTEMATRAAEAGIDLNQIESVQILGMGKPDDIAAMTAFLLSDMSSLITGRKFFVDGGRFA